MLVLDMLEWTFEYHLFVFKNINNTGQLLFDSRCIGVCMHGGSSQIYRLKFALIWLQSHWKTKQIRKVFWNCKDIILNLELSIAWVNSEIWDQNCALMDYNNVSEIHLNLLLMADFSQLIISLYNDSVQMHHIDSGITQFIKIKIKVN